MTTVTSFTAERMLEIENETIVNAALDGNDLILTTREGTDINVGSVRGSTGAAGSTGPAGAGIAIGQLGMFPKSPLPFGWLETDGTTKLISAYPDLAAYLGTTYGGNGTTTFGLPGYAGRVLVGRDTTDVNFDTLGETGGSKNVTLTEAQMPQHSHGVGSLAAPSHVHSVSHVHYPGAGAAYGFMVGHAGGPFQGPAGGAGSRIDAQTTDSSAPNTGGPSATALTGAMNLTGSGTSHTNLQPYRVVLMAIYAGA